MYLFDGVREMQPPRSESTGPVRRGVSVRKQDKSPGAAWIRFKLVGRSRKNIVPVAYGGIVVRDFFRPGAPGGMEQLLWDRRSSSGETPEVAMARSVVPIFLTPGSTGVHETGSGRRHRSWS